MVDNPGEKNVGWPNHGWRKQPYTANTYVGLVEVYSNESRVYNAFHAVNLLDGRQVYGNESLI